MNKLMVLVSLVTLLAISGCSFKETNALIATANTARYEAFVDGMNAAESEGARIAISMAYASNMGMQDFYRPESPLDYMKGALPYFSMGMSFWGGGERTDSPSIKAGRDVFIDSSKSDTSSMINSVDSWVGTVGYGNPSVSNEGTEGMPWESAIAEE